eukprot:GHVU01180427.1.p1 GENE.GHVU01180427.1~~GHVU01180427.1.p1  ORF type:complete len:214 (-),score=10.35 GHVU01180427.1:66-626(-)
MGYAFFTLLVLLSPRLLAKINQNGLGISKELVYCQVSGVKCEGCLHDVKTRIGKFASVTGVSAQFGAGGVSDVVISATSPIPEPSLQGALKAEHSLKVLKWVSVIRNETLEPATVDVWMVTYSPGKHHDASLGKGYSTLPGVQNVTTLPSPFQHIIAARAGSLDEAAIRKAAADSNLVIESVRKKE